MEVFHVLLKQTLTFVLLWKPGEKSGLHPHFDAVLKNDVLTFFHINVLCD